MKTYFKIFLGLFLLLPFSTACAQEIERSSSPEGAVAYIISPAHGEVVTGPVVVKFGLKGMGVAPAGIKFPDAGHHHLLINATELPDLNAPIPSDDVHRHFGKGQTETTLDLEPGTYTLQIILGDQFHIPHDPAVISEKITITVK